MVGVTALGARALSASPAGLKKKVIVAGAGIAGLTCAYKLAKQGFEVVLLEAAGRSGGHILTIHDRLADGLYADAGAEHFYRPGYDLLWQYIDEFNLPVIPYGRRKNLMRWMGDRFYSPDELSTPKVLRALGFNQREIEHLGKYGWGSLPGLYYRDYFDRFADEYRPFEAKLGELDSITSREFLLQQGASAAGAGAAGGRQSALQAIWHAAIRRKRNMSWLELKLFRIRGGNQRLTEAFASRLGDRLRLGCPISHIEHSPQGVRVAFREAGKEKHEEADYLVSCLPLTSLRQVSVNPEWTPAKRYVIDKMPYDSHARVIFQSRTRFWETDRVSPSMTMSEASLGMVWSMAEEVATKRGILVGDAPPTTPGKAEAAFRRRYPGRSEDIEQTLIVNWTTDPWATSCIPTSLPPGVLAKYWPEVIIPHGRIHFAGVYADSYPFGMESAVRSAHRAVNEIEGIA